MWEVLRIRNKLVYFLLRKASRIGPDAFLSDPDAQREVSSDSFIRVIREFCGAKPVSKNFF